MNVATKPAEHVIEAEVQEAPAPQLPAIRQERKPRAPTAPKPAVYSATIAKAILAVASQIGAIQKEGWNDFQKYKYTRWEDIAEKLSPLLIAHNLIINQSELSRSLLEENDKGSVLAIVYHFTIINSEGEQWPAVEWTGIARLRDGKGVTDDKAALKAQTQAEKSFCVKQFKIITEQEDEDDKHDSLPKKNARDVYSKMQAEIAAQTSLVELGVWGNQNSDRIKVLPPDWQGILRGRYAEKKADLENQLSTDPTKEVWDEETGEVA